MGWHILGCQKPRDTTGVRQRKKLGWLLWKRKNKLLKDLKKKGFNLRGANEGKIL